MHRSRRLAVSLMLAGSAALALGPGAAQAQAFPNKPLHIVVPYPPGGSTDILARTLGEYISKAAGQPVLVDNRAGASGNIGAAFVAKSPADGYTIFLGTSTALSVNPSLFKSLPYDPEKDFTPIVLATLLPSLVVVPEKSPFRTLPELTKRLQDPASRESYASSGNGTPAHLGGELYKKMANAHAAHVPYKGGAPALTDLMGDQTSYMIAILPESMPFVKTGKLRALAVTTAQRLPAYPDIPTVSESGVPGYELIGWYGFLAPAGTPKDVLERLNALFNAGLKDKAVQAKLQDMGFEVAGGPANALTDLMRKETPKWRKVIEEAKVTVD